MISRGTSLSHAVDLADEAGFAVGKALEHDAFPAPSGVFEGPDFLALGGSEQGLRLDGLRSCSVLESVDSLGDAAVGTIHADGNAVEGHFLGLKRLKERMIFLRPSSVVDDCGWS